MAEDALLWCYGILNVFNMILHCIGSYLLYRRRKDFLLLLLFSQANFVYAAINFGFFIIVITHSSNEIYVIIATMFRIPFYWLMMMLTVERFLVVYLHLRYNNSLFEKHKFKITIMAWPVYIILTAVCCIVYKINDLGNFYNNLTKSKYHLLGHAIVTVVFVFCYGYIYIKIKAMRVTQNDVYQTRKWRIFVPFIIVFSFLICRGITELITVFVLKKLELFIIFLYSLDFTINGIAYVFLQPTLRRDFVRLFTRRRVRVAPTSGSDQGMMPKHFTRSTEDQNVIWVQRRVPTPNSEPDIMSGNPVFQG